MKISSLPQFYRNLRRWTEILSVLSRYGLADWLSRTNVDFVKDRLKDREGGALARHTQEKRIRLALTDLGPTFIKMGQFLSTRPDLVGVALADELKKLQCDAPADPPHVIREIVERELGQTIEELFLDFEDEPVASASIGQVHRARLPNGDPVVVKVQHAGIEQKVAEDLDVLSGLAALAERIPEFAAYHPRSTVAELGRWLKRELDFGREERNLLQFATLFENNPHVHVPQPFTEFCTTNVLTMERLEGFKLSQTPELVAAGFDLEEIARRGAGIYLEMIFENGFYHADPHPGNIVLMPGNIIGLMDFGMVGRIEERLREDIEEMLAAIVQRDVTLLTSLIMRVGKVPGNLDESALCADVADFVGIYAHQSLNSFRLGPALNDMIEIIHRYQITLPSQVALLLKTLVTLEGTTRMLSPSFSLMEVMSPFHRKMLIRRWSPRRHVKKFRRAYSEFGQLAEVFPRRMMDILEQIQSGKFDVHLEHRGLGPSVNRLVLGLLASALFLGSSLLLAMEVPPLVFAEGGFWGLERLSILGLTGCTTSILLGLRLFRAINKSGHLDRRE